MFGSSKPAASGYGAVPTLPTGINISQATDLVKQFTGTDPQKFVDVTRDQINKIVKYAEEGDWTWKILGMFGGLAMMATGVLNFMAHFFLFDYFGAVLDVYIILFGLLSVILEYKENILPSRWVDNIKVEAKFIYKPYGRAVLYIFFGVLLVSQQQLFYLCTGLYLCGIGALVVYYAGQAQKALDNFKGQKLSSFQLKSAFDKVDKDKNGLRPKELAQIFSKYPGCTLSENEMESAVGLLDKDNSGRVSYAEFSTWYNAR